MANSADLSKGLPANPEKATLDGKNKFLGAWVFLAGETTMFAVFFGTYLGLQSGTAGGPEPSEIFQLPLVFIMTMLLLTSSLTSVMAIYAMKKNQFQKLKRWMWITVALGAVFLGFEIYEFVEYVEHGLGFTTSAFASSFYALVGLHGAHVLFGLLWATLLLVRNRNAGITLTNAPKFYVFSLYWHFIDVVWVFIFSAVYLMGIGG
ncbi:cytochrome c oxidase subunit 3 [Geomicrobium halophilum]|uniref:Cytochrome c oxidase subunit 3 n=1 Tax=Geomicrobium halophilum TaxID=549000 RepID=A0A841PSZ0_9BACL|nr:cytochrome (ubi)quinol oxidase subunit III [Geomicrobium halophilum]MBB6449421.1 cytochrome c oxidase subunit 3 [Geomicrobium halophilum]